MSSSLPELRQVIVELLDGLAESLAQGLDLLRDLPMLGAQLGLPVLPLDVDGIAELTLGDALVL